MPSRNSLPAAPAGKAGWPWESKNHFQIDGPLQGTNWPRITVVTPSFNQGQFVEATLRSVLLQGYPNLEFIVLDGGSSDDSVDAIRRYEKSLTYWHSRSDRGQADALAAGFKMATGSIYCWLNSDDILLPGSLRRIGTLFARHRRVDVVYGNRLVIDRDGAVIGRHIWPWHLTSAHWALGQPLAQECCFWRREVYEKVGGIDSSKFFIMDYDLFFRMWRVGRFRKTTDFLGCLRTHAGTKNSRHADIWRRELAAAKAKFHLREPGYVERRVLNRLDRIQLQCEELLVHLKEARTRDWGLEWRLS